MIKKNGVSVIIPTWNNAATIKRAIKSCLAQTFLPLEILVCDDGSTDKSETIIKSTIGSPLIKWIDGKEHSGKPAVPRNKGIKKSKGQWLAFLDADDMWLPDKLKRQITAVEQTKCLAVCSNAYKVEGYRRKTPFFTTPQKLFTVNDLIKTNSVICSSMMFHHSLLKYAGWFPEDNKLRSAEDYALWLRIAAQTNIVYLSQPLVLYNDKPQLSIRSKVNQNHLTLRIEVLKNFLSWLNKANKYHIKININPIKIRVYLQMLRSIIALKV